MVLECSVVGTNGRRDISGVMAYLSNIIKHSTSWIRGRRYPPLHTHTHTHAHTHTQNEWHGSNGGVSTDMMLKFCSNMDLSTASSLAFCSS